MIDAVALDYAQDLHQSPPAYVWTAGRKSKSNRKREDAPSRFAPAIFVGAVIVLTDEDGKPYECEVTTVTEDGQWFCTPLKKP